MDMNTRNFIILLALAIMFVTSCVPYQPIDNPEEPDPTLDLNFKFETRSDRTINITAFNETGTKAGGVLFSIFTENPYISDGSRDLTTKPIYQGYTEADGTLTITFDMPNSSDRVYIVPEFAGFGPMLDFSTKDFEESLSLVFKGIQQPGTKAPITKAAVAPRESIKKGNNFSFYTYYRDSEYNPADGVLSPGELVSYEEISTDFKSMVHDWYPEEGLNYEAFSEDSDLYITEDNTEVWVTYLGDGGFSNANRNSWSSLYFYTYTSATKPTRTFLYPGYIAKTDELHMTAALINTCPEKTVVGTKVQLMYWDGTQFVSSFPAGTYIGFTMVKDGYKKSNGTIGFNIQDGMDRSSTAALNRDGLIHGVFHWSDLYRCFVLGMEYNNSKDADFNDVVVKITTSKVAKLDKEYPLPSVPVPEYSYMGTIAFEDTWPDKGDYDMNDFVADYQYDLIKVPGTNNISGMRVSIHPLAAGASQINGFGVQIPILVTNISNVSGGSLEDGQTLATTIVYDDVKSAFVGAGEGFVNTVNGQPILPSSTSVIEYTFVSPINERNVSFNGINPFLFKAEDRSREIHLVNYAPTLKANMNSFGTLYDKSVPTSGIYYRMDNTFPWAIDISKSKEPLWIYPIEKVGINKTYLKFGDWVTNPTSVWYDATIETNVDANYLFRRISE